MSEACSHAPQDCPFCASSRITAPYRLKDGVRHWLCACADCKACGPEATDKESAVTKWNAETSGHALLKRIAECCEAMAFQSGGSGVDLAGHTLSHLASNPEHIPRYMLEGNELWIDGTITYFKGSLSFVCVDGVTRTASEVRRMKGDQQ